MSAELKTVEPIHVVGVKHTGAFSQIGDSFAKVFGKAGAGSWPIQGCLAIFYSDPREVPEAEQQSAACVITPEEFDPKDESAKAFVIPGGQYAVMRHVGPYSELPDVWMKFYSEELPKLGVDDAGAPYELYMNDPQTTPQAELITDIHIPVKPRS